MLAEHPYASVHSTQCGERTGSRGPCRGRWRLQRVSHDERCRRLSLAVFWLEAEVTGAADASRLLERLDSTTATGIGGSIMLRQSNANIASLRAAKGDFAGAHRALKRTGGAFDLMQFQSTWLRERGRIAALAGDTTAAVRDLTDYLRLHTRAGPSVQPRIEEVQRLLASLTGESRR